MTHKEGLATIIIILAVVAIVGNLWNMKEKSSVRGKRMVRVEIGMPEIVRTSDK